MVSAVAWVGLPLLLWAVGTGVGLLAERLARVKLSNGLLAPLGACVAVVLVLPVYRLGGTAPVAAPLLVAVAVLGLVLARRTLVQRVRLGFCGAAGLAAGAVYLAPVVLSGHWTWLGYNFVNDPANNMLFVDHLGAHGFDAPTGPPSSATRMVGDAIGAHYPFGAFTLLATLRGVLGVETAALYQPFIATLAGLSATSLAVLARRLGMRAPWAAALGALSVCASLTYDYSAHGGVKEIALVLVLVTAAALAREGMDARWRPGAFALAAIVLAAGVGVFSAAAGAYVALLAVVLAAAYAIEVPRPPLRRVLAATGLAAVAFLLAALPTLMDALSFLTDTAPVFSGEGGLSGPNSTVVLGYLARPLPLYQALGIWPADDYRFPLEGGRWAFTLVAMALAGALIAAAVVLELRRRRLGALLLLAPTLLTYAIAAPRLAPYPDAKLLVVLSPAAVFAAGIGAWRLCGSPRLRVPALLAMGVVAAGIVLSDALAYHNVRLAATTRMEALQDAAEHAPAGGLLLLNEWEEYGKYFARSRQINTGSESFSPAPVVPRENVPIFATSFDTDQMTLEYVEAFPSLLLRRAPDASRPPANFERTYRNAYYDVWRRRPAPQVFEHLSLQELQRRGIPARCADVRAMAKRVRPGERLVGVRAGESPRLDIPERPPAGWNENAVPGTVTPGTPGDPSGTVRVDGGRYRAWVRGSTGRPLTVTVDDRAVGRASGVNTPGQWLPAGDLELAAGTHRLGLRRPGGGLGPGDGYAGEIGPVVLEPVLEQQLVSVPARRAAATFCRGAWDWVERVG